MIPFGNETITLYHRTRTEANGRSKDTWTRLFLSGCSVIRRAKSAASDDHAHHSEEVICRIPARYQAPEVGDVIVPGKVSDSVNSARDASALIDSRNGAFRVNSVKHNNRPGFPMPHYAVRSE